MLQKARLGRIALLALAAAELFGIAKPSTARAEDTPPEDTEDEVTTVVVPGERQAPNQTGKEPSVASSVISRERLSAPGLGAAGALRGTAGAFVNELGGFGSYATASTRGATAAQTPVYVGGVRVNDEVGGAADLATIPLWFIDRVEVYRGNAPIEADRLGIGGAIFFEPRKPDGTHLELGGVVGSFATRSAWVAASAGDQADGVIAGVGFGAAENDFEYQDDAGTLFDPADDRVRKRTNADASLIDVWLNARRRVADAQLSLLAHYGHVERGVPRLAVLPARATREEANRALVAISTRTPFGAPGQWLEASTSALGSTVRLDDPLLEAGYGVERLDLSGTRVENSLGVRLEPHRSWTLRPTLVASVERLEREERPTAQDPPTEQVAHRVDVRPAVASEFRFADTGIALRFLLALECSSAGESGLGLCDDAWTTGRVGPTVRAGRFFAYANLGRYVRLPTLGERFGTTQFVRGNPRLAPELGLTVDAGVRYQTREVLDLWLDVAGFARWARDLVTYRRTAQGYVIPENRDQARVLGVELAMGVTPIPGIGLDVSATALDPRDTTPDRLLKNDVLPFLSRLTVSPGLSLFHRVDSTLLSSLGAHARYVYESSRYADPAGLAVLPEQGNLEVEISASWVEQSIASRVRLHNALDQQRVDVVGFPLPGRSLYASIEARY